MRLIKQRTLKFQLISHCVNSFLTYCISIFLHWPTLYFYRHSADTRISRCVCAIRSLAHDFFGVALEVAEGSLELVKSERALQRTALSYAYNDSRQLYVYTRMLIHCKFD